MTKYRWNIHHIHISRERKKIKNILKAKAIDGLPCNDKVSCERKPQDLLQSLIAVISSFHSVRGYGCN